MTFMTRFRTIMTISPFFPFDLHCDSNLFPSGLSVTSDLVVVISFLLLSFILSFTLTPCHLGPVGDLVHVLRPRPVVEEQLDLLALLPAHINLPKRPHPSHEESLVIDHLGGLLLIAMCWQLSTFKIWQIYQLASSLPPTTSTSSTLNAGLT